MWKNGLAMYLSSFYGRFSFLGIQEQNKSLESKLHATQIESESREAQVAEMRVLVQETSAQFQSF